MTSPLLLCRYSPTATYPWPCAIEPKIDGWRCLAVCDDDGAWTLVSREGVDLTDAALPIVNDLRRCLPGARGLVLDGELASYTLEQTQRELHAGLARTVRYYVWDVITLAEWQAGGSERPLEARREALDALLRGAGCRLVSRVDRQIVDSHEATQRVYERHRRRGWEGAVVKLLGSPWRAGQRDYWYKIKPGEGA